MYKWINKPAGRTIIIGDIHGCYDEMIALLNKISFSKKDILICVGDLIDRGPNSKAVVEYFTQTENVFSVLGNHERKVYRILTGQLTEFAWTQQYTLECIDNKDKELWKTYFKSLPAVIETPNVIVVHSLLNPFLPLKEQSVKQVCGTTNSIEHNMLRTNEKGIPNWYLLWRKNTNIDKTLCVGHVTYKQVEMVKNKFYALDTSGVKGGFLSALILPDYKIVQYKVEKNYYEISHSKWNEIKIKYISIEKSKINSILKLQNKIDKTKFEQALIDDFFSKVSEMQIEERINKLKSKIYKRFGAIPTANRDKGFYFKQLRESLPKCSRYLFKCIVSKCLYSQDIFLTQNKHKKLEQIEQELTFLENILNK